MGTALVTLGEEGTHFSRQRWQPLDLTTVMRAEQGAAAGADRQAPEPSLLPNPGVGTHVTADYHSTAGLKPLRDLSG